MKQERINFSPVRDFTEIFNASVKFVSQNFKQFFQAMLFIAGPFLLISSICSAIYQAYLIDTGHLTQRGFSFNSADIFQLFGWQYFLLLLVGIFGRIILLTTAYAYVIAYNLYGPGNFGVTEVRKIVFQNLGKTIKGFFICFLIILFLLLILAGIVGLMISIVPILTSVVLVIAIIVAILISPPFIWQFSTFYLVQMKDDKGVLDAMRKVRELMRGEFFSTWLVMVVAGLILSVLAIIFSIPQLAYQLILQLGNIKLTENSIPFLIVSTICAFLVTFVFSLFYIINSFQFYSLDEKKHGAALINRIDDIGNTPLNDVDQHY